MSLRISGIRSPPPLARPKRAGSIPVFTTGLAPVSWTGELSPKKGQKGPFGFGLKQSSYHIQKD